MTWIDERLFGWSRSSRRGTSAWSGSVEDPSRIHTPEDSDVEDTGDYDNVVGVLGTGVEQSNLQKSRSRQSSYADLQRLRLNSLASLSNTTGAAAHDESTLAQRAAHRTRRQSLSDGVDVSRIAATDQKETFQEVTDDLNAEIAKTKSS